jgi:hypothetical protein
VRLWQALCALGPLVAARDAPSVGSALRDVLGAMGTPDLASVKQYQEVLVVSAVRSTPWCAVQGSSPEGMQECAGPAAPLARGGAPWQHPARSPCSR